jgi:anti-sigma regulatory factor (Ser/Thr protein kinase)
VGHADVGSSATSLLWIHPNSASWWNNHPRPTDTSSGQAIGGGMGQWRATADIPATPLGPSTARHVVGALLEGWQLAGVAADAALVVSELVTNAVEHAPVTDSFELELVCHADRVRITLADGSSIRPVVRELSAQEPRGRGMRLVSELADDWGAEDFGTGKRVWVELTVG